MSEDLHVMHWNKPEWQTTDPAAKRFTRWLKRAFSVRRRPPRELHCWTEGPRRYVYFDHPAEDPGQGSLIYPGVREIGSTCLLPDGHKGEHVWTPDDQIMVRFR